VPPPILNTGLDEIIRALDGTRYYYTPNSRSARRIVIEISESAARGGLTVTLSGWNVRPASVLVATAR
jgi:hypothetical protein